MIRLMLADDHMIVREGIKQLLTMVDDITVVAEAENGSSLLERLREGDIDLLLLDMTMPGISGEGLIVQIREHYPELPILILSMHNEPKIARLALRGGASGYITKDQDPEMLFDAIRRVAAGNRFIDPSLSERMALEFSGVAERSSHEDLTAREIQIFRLFAKGVSVNQIAEQLFISNKTVSTHKSRLMEKMALTSNAELVRYAIAHGLVD